PVDHRAEDGAFAFVEVVAAGELAVAAGFDVDRDQLLFLISSNEGGDALAVGGEDGARLRLVGQGAQLVRFGRTDLLHPEALGAAEDQDLAVRRDVFDVGGADAADLLLHPGAVLAHRVDVGVGGRAGTALAAAVDDAGGEEARRELVDRAGFGQI